MLMTDKGGRKGWGVCFLYSDVGHLLHESQQQYYYLFLNQYRLPWQLLSSDLTL